MKKLPRFRHGGSSLALLVLPLCATKTYAEFGGFRPFSPMARQAPVPLLCPTVLASPFKASINEEGNDEFRGLEKNTVVQEDGWTCLRMSIWAET